MRLSPKLRPIDRRLMKRNWRTIVPRFLSLVGQLSRYVPASSIGARTFFPLGPRALTNRSSLHRLHISSIRCFYPPLPFFFP